MSTTSARTSDVLTWRSFSTTRHGGRKSGLPMAPVGLAGGHSLSTSTVWRPTYGITNVVSELARNQLPDLEWREPCELCDDLNQLIANDATRDELLHHGRDDGTALAARCPGCRRPHALAHELPQLATARCRNWGTGQTRRSRRAQAGRGDGLPPYHRANERRLLVRF